MSAPTNSNSHFHNATTSTNGNSNQSPKSSIGEDMPWESTGRGESDFTSVIITQTFQQRLTGRVNQGHQMLERQSS